MRFLLLMLIVSAVPSFAQFSAESQKDKTAYEGLSPEARAILNQANNNAQKKSFFNMAITTRFDGGIMFAGDLPFESGVFNATAAEFYFGSGKFKFYPSFRFSTPVYGVTRTGLTLYKQSDGSAAEMQRRAASIS